MEKMLKLNTDTLFTQLYHLNDSTVLPEIKSIPDGLNINHNLSLMLGLSFSSLLFLIALFGILWNQKNIIIVFLCVELMLFGAALPFLFYSLFFNLALGQIYALLILTVATAETAVGLGITILAYRLNQCLSFTAFTVLRR